MTDAVVLELLQQPFWVAFRLAGPVLGMVLLLAHDDGYDDGVFD